MNRSVLSLVLATLLIGAAGRADAGIIINVQQVGSDVVATGSGSIDLTGLTLVSSSGAFDLGRVFPAAGTILEGPTSGIPLVSEYSGVTGPTSFGPGVSNISASSGSGDIFGVAGLFAHIELPLTYTSGTLLSPATDTYTGTTIAGMGLIPGTYTYHWGDPTHPDPARTLTVQIGPVPEPASLAIWGLGALGCAIAGYRRRKKTA